MSEKAVATVVESETAPRGSAEGKSHFNLWILLGLTIFSGEICFNRLSQPSMMIDECFTYWRICGSMDQLLDTLRNDAFMPLYYELMNWIHLGFPLGFGRRLVPGGIFLTPVAMRFVTALSMTLMTPAMYFLARQIFNRRTALIAAAFIACSAYGLFYAHYAKMYTPAWLMETLAMGCFAWWMRTWVRLAWLCWITASIAAAGFHAVTLLVLPLAPLYFISMGRFGGRRIAMLVGGLLIIAIAPGVYYGVYNRWTHNSGGLVPGVVGEPATYANWDASGLSWLEHIDNSIDPSFAALNMYLSGFDWTRTDDLAHPAEAVAKFSTAMVAMFMATYGLFILGMLPWPHLHRAARSDPSVQPWWRSLLWLSLWLVMPVYGFFYCRSVEDFSSPVVWLEALFEFARPAWWCVLAGIGVALLLGWQPRVAKFVAAPLILLSIFAIVQTARDELSWMDTAVTPVGFITLFALAPAVIFHYAGGTLKQRSIELLRLLAVVGVVLALCGVMFLVWTWLHDLSMRKNPELPWQPVWHDRYVAIVWPAVWLAAAALVARLPTRALRIGAVLMICSYNLANGLAREYGSTEVPFDRVVADIYKSQPHSDTRTYFDMRRLFNNTLYKPMALYNACLVARLQPEPGEFRVDSSWPFEYGVASEWFKSKCIYNPSISSEKIRDDLSNDPEISRIIVWKIIARGPQPWLGDDEDPEAGLTGKWVKKSDEEITSHWYWDWSDQWTFRRMEFDRVAGG